MEGEREGKVGEKKRDGILKGGIHFVESMG